MKIVLVPLVFLLSVSLLKAGSVNFIADKPGIQGKLTLHAASIHVDGSSAPDINLSDVLEADFSDDNFHLDYFSSGETTADQLPAGWQGQDIGRVDSPGTYTYAKGTLTINGNGRGINAVKDRLYYLSRPWTGNGVWTMHVKNLTPAEVGLMLRTDFDPSAAMFGFGTGPVRIDGGANGLQHHRNNAGEGSQWNAINVDEPFWLRVSRNSTNFDIALSNDGRTWGNVEQDFMAKFPPSFRAGFFITSNAEDVVGSAVVDHILFTPVPAEPETLAAGVLLGDGTFLAGSFDGLDPKGGNFNHLGQEIPISPDQVASVIWDTATRSQLAAVDKQSGLLMKNNDFVEAELQAIQGMSCQMSSITLGILNYYNDKVRAIVLHPVKPLPSTYEVRLKDGSLIRAKAISENNGQLVITDVSGIEVNIDPGEVAQFRAGSALGQTLIDLPWKATPATVPVPAADVAPAAPASTASAPNAPSTTNTVAVVQAPAAAPAAAPEQVRDQPSVLCWQGNNQEQIMAVMPGTSIDFPLSGKFRALALKVALLPDAPPGAQATLRILADGKEVAQPTPFKAGDPPRFVQVTLHSPKTVTLVATTTAGVKVLYIDPVAVRE